MLKPALKQRMRRARLPAQGQVSMSGKQHRARSSAGSERDIPGPGAAFGARVGSVRLEYGPICAMWAGGGRPGGNQNVGPEIDAFFSPTGNFCRLYLGRKMNNSFVANIGHLDNEIDIAGWEGLEGMKVGYILTSLLDVTVIVFDSERAFSLSCVTGHPSFGMMSCCFTNQELAMLWELIIMFSVRHSPSSVRKAAF